MIKLIAFIQLLFFYLASESLNNDKPKQTHLTCLQEDKKEHEKKESIDNCDNFSKDNYHLFSRSSSSSSISSSCSHHSMIKHYTNIIINNRESLDGQNVVRDKIERILKSQWEERLNKTKEKNFSISSHFRKSNSTSSFLLTDPTSYCDHLEPSFSLLIVVSIFCHFFFFEQLRLKPNKLKNQAN